MVTDSNLNGVNCFDFVKIPSSNISKFETLIAQIWI